jgi:lysophospholipase L1-like esterase
MMDDSAMGGPAPGDTAKPRLTWKIRLLLVGFGLCVAFLSMEIGLRTVEALRPAGAGEGWSADQLVNGEYWAIYDPELGYRQNPRFADMNSDGLRDRPIGPKGDRFRVLLLGDSLAVYGDSIDDTFVGHLRASLARDGTFSRVDVIDGGVKGYTNYQEVTFLQRTGVRFQPDLVGFEFCLNDLFKFLHSFAMDQGRLVPGTYQFSTEAVAQTHENVLISLAKHSRALMWLNSHVSIARNAAAWAAHGGYAFDYRADVRNAWLDDSWRDIERQLGDAVALGRDRHFPVFVVAFPLAAQYDAAYLAKDRDYVLKPQRTLRDICERLGIAFYDIYPDLTAKHFVDDGLHLTPEGRRVAGAKIAAFLAKSGLLPPG